MTITGLLTVFCLNYQSTDKGNNSYDDIRFKYCGNKNEIVQKTKTKSYNYEDKTAIYQEMV